MLEMLQIAQLKFNKIYCVMIYDIYDELKPQVINKKKLKELLEQLAMNCVEEADNGGITWKDK